MDRLVVAEYEVEEFCFSSHLSWAKSLAPNLIDLISCLLTSRRGSEADDIQNEKATAIVFGVMMRQRSRSKASMVIPMLVSALLLGHATSKQVIRALNAMGIAASYTHSWDTLKAISNNLVVPESRGNSARIVTFDNLNITKNVLHERADIHMERWDMTTRLVIDFSNITNLQSLTDNRRVTRRQLLEADILPSADDNDLLTESGTEYIMRFMTSTFPSLSHISSSCPQRKPFRVPCKPDVTPLEILDINEGKKDGNIDIMKAIAQDLHKSDCNPLPIVGDQLTCKNIRAAKRLRKPEPVPFNTLQWANESPGDFHFLWECLGLCFETLWGKDTCIGTLAHMKLLIKRNAVDKSAKKFQSADEFFSMFSMLIWPQLSARNWDSKYD
ncbi:uncharacterized protein [Oscarella lobularis]|uniref:uncharacterized protein n=1 Tax=Oscarella lobularis TaxID=121494 RepID=UPI00331312D8